jgi:hypothetical protein
MAYGNKKVFFGDFLSPDKKLPAGRRTAEAVKKSHWIPVFAGMTSLEARAGFQLSLE